MSGTFRYPTFHWLTTLVVAPFLLFAYALLSSGLEESTGGPMFYWLAFVVGALLSIPTYVVYLFVFRWLFERIRSSLVLKVLCNVLVIGCAGLTFLLVGGGAAWRFFVLYATAVILSSILLRIPHKPKPVAAPVG